MSACYSRIVHPMMKYLKVLLIPDTLYRLRWAFFSVSFFFFFHSFPVSFWKHPASLVFALIPYLRAFVFCRQRYKVKWKWKSSGHGLCPEKITMTAVAAPTFFPSKTFLIPLSHTCLSRKKRLKLRWGMILNLKKKVSGCERHRKGNPSKKV